MKFIEVDKARKLDFNTPVFVRIDNDPTPAVGRMLKVEHTAQGVVRTFEVAGFSEDWSAKGRTIIQLDKEPQSVLVPFTTDKVTHVCIPS
jgi:hypothetical protein